MKWINLLWSIVLLGLLALILTYLSSRISDVTIGPSFGYGLIVWIIICLVSPIILTLRILRVIVDPSSFVYILTGTANLAIGVLGLYFVYPGGYFRNKQIFILILSVNVLLGLFIYVDAFIRTIPGSRKE
jgi:hypothetical protein